MAKKIIGQHEKNGENDFTCLCSSISKMFLRDIETSTSTGCPEKEIKCQAHFSILATSSIYQHGNE